MIEENLCPQKNILQSNNEGLPITLKQNGITNAIKSQSNENKQNDTTIQKKCKKCHEVKKVCDSNFQFRLERNKYREHCKICRNKRKTELLNNKKKDPVFLSKLKSKDSIRKKIYRKNHQDFLFEKRKMNIVKILLSKSKTRAKTQNMEHNIAEEDIIIPLFCPVLGIPIFVSRGKVSDNSPSLDRINNNLGYIKGNVKVISYKANALKSNGSINEFRKIIEYIKANE